MKSQKSASTANMPRLPNPSAAADRSPGSSSARNEGTANDITIRSRRSDSVPPKPMRSMVPRAVADVRSAERSRRRLGESQCGVEGRLSGWWFWVRVHI
ncbi:hypothetical protein BD626DRAFT_271622 [Schizophyllum amplum]|uniref:Uncharacterized protein n=1 Tax=Schizophyllum amplum TaxID=97359 RepID=A0A550CF42_9AGAR|nr:hypothetical protein BD626DRAFT_271622 [Auriculariopsis ampla]